MMNEKAGESLMKFTQIGEIFSILLSSANFFHYPQNNTFMSYHSLDVLVDGFQHLVDNSPAFGLISR